LKKDNQGRILAAMPLAYIDSKNKIIRQPPLCIYLGPYFSRLNPPLTLTKQMRILEEMAVDLQLLDYYNQNWHPSVLNWLPFYWQGFTQSSRYSYQIRVQTKDQVDAGYDSEVKRIVKNASTQLRIIESNDVSILLNTINKTFERKNHDNPYDIGIFNSVWKVCHERKCCKIFFALDPLENVHAAIFLIWDNDSVYYLAGGMDNKYKSGAMTLLIDHSIKMAIDMGKIFDFEGSMIRSIEKYFRSFGAVQREYFVLTKVNSKILKLRFALAKIYAGFAPF
jgi:hypothetical protein